MPGVSVCVCVCQCVCVCVCVRVRVRARAPAPAPAWDQSASSQRRQRARPGPESDCGIFIAAVTRQNDVNQGQLCLCWLICCTSQKTPANRSVWLEALPVE